MSDLTDSRVVASLMIEAAENVSAFPTESDSWHDVATSLLTYHEELRDLMAVELAATPGDAQEAVYDAQVEQVAEMERFLDTAGAGESSLIWVL